MTEPNEIVLSRITIERYLADTGWDLVRITTGQPGEEGPLPVVEALGMLQLAIYDVMTTSPGDGDDE